MKEVYCTKPFRRLHNLYYYGYTPEYCDERKLFIVRDKQGHIKYMTKAYVDFAQEVINTDYVLILGTKLAIRSPFPDLELFLNEYINQPSFGVLLEKFIMQGLILGDTVLRFSLDTNGAPVLDLVNLVDTRISYFKEGFRVVGYAIEYQTYFDGELSNVREEYYYNGVKYIIDGQEHVVPHEDNMLWLIHVANRPSLFYDVWGESDLEQIYEAIDSINSTFARMDAIEDIYAKPRLIASGLREFNFREQDNVLAINENASIQILEYRGQILPAMLDKVKFLEQYLKEVMPELLLSNLRELTGYALKLKLIKLIKKIETYRRAYFTGLKHALTLVAKHSGFEQIKFDFVLDDVVPSDEMQDVNKLLLLVSAGLLSKRSAAEKLGIDYALEEQRMEMEFNKEVPTDWLGVDNKLRNLITAEEASSDEQ